MSDYQPFDENMSIVLPCDYNVTRMNDDEIHTPAEFVDMINLVFSAEKCRKRSTVSDEGYSDFSAEQIQV